MVKEYMMGCNVASNIESIRNYFKLKLGIGSTTEILKNSLEDLNSNFYW
jgi:hypothetical protein